MFTLDEEPRSKKLLPKMFMADLTIPQPHSTDSLDPTAKHPKQPQHQKSPNHLKNLSIQTEELTKNPKSFDLKQYLNRNSPKYYNLKEKLTSFQNSVKAKVTTPLPTKPSPNRNHTPNPLNAKGISTFQDSSSSTVRDHKKVVSSFHESATKNNAQNSTIDQTPIPKDKDDSRKSSNKQEEHDADYENNFIVAKINNFFKGGENKQGETTPTKKKVRKSIPKEEGNNGKRKISEEVGNRHTPVNKFERSFDCNNGNKKLKTKMKSEERPKTAFPKRNVSPPPVKSQIRSVKKFSCDDQNKNNKNSDKLFQINENIENEDLHGRYEKELKNLLGKDTSAVGIKNKKINGNHSKVNKSMTDKNPNNPPHKDSASSERKTGTALKNKNSVEKKSFDKKESTKEKPKKSLNLNEKQESKGENPQVPSKSDEGGNLEEVITRKKKKTLEKFITQINRGEIFAKPIEEVEEKPVKKAVMGKKINNKISPSPNDKKTKDAKKNGKITSDANIKPAPEKKKFIYYSTNLALSYKMADSNDYFLQLYKEHFSQTFQALSYCKGIRQAEIDQIEEKKVFLKKRESHLNKKTLIFDLDETLIHCNEMMDVPSDVVLPITFPNGEVIEAGINIRPFLYEVLNILKECFEIIVFTASHNCYANKVLDYIDPKHELIHHRLFREHCVVTEEGIHIKDLRVISNRKLDDIVIVDNACYSFGYQIDNGVPIIPYYDNKQDEELKHLVEYLKGLVMKDIKETNRNTFKLTSYQKFQTIEDLEEVLFDEI